MDSNQDIDVAPFWGDLSKSGKLSWIKPPLFYFWLGKNLHLIPFTEFTDAFGSGTMASFEIFCPKNIWDKSQF